MKFLVGRWKNMQQQQWSESGLRYHGLGSEGKILYNTKVLCLGSWSSEQLCVRDFWMCVSCSEVCCGSDLPKLDSGTFLGPLLQWSCSPYYTTANSLSLYSVSSSNEQQQQLLFCAHDDPLFQGLELSTLFLLNIWLEEPFSRNTDCSYLNDLSHRQKTHTANWLQDCSEIRYKGVVICWLYIELWRQNYRRAC